jgi:hypothetical protein
MNAEAVPAAKTGAADVAAVEVATAMTTIDTGHDILSR